MTENKVADSFEFTVQENNKDKKVTVIVVHNLDNEKHSISPYRNN